MSNFDNKNNWHLLYDSLYYNYLITNYEILKKDYGLRYQLAHVKKKNINDIENIITNAYEYSLFLKNK